jgi:hypothetical protein
MGSQRLRRPFATNIWWGPNPVPQSGTAISLSSLKRIGDFDVNCPDAVDVDEFLRRMGRSASTRTCEWLRGCPLP